MLSAVGDDGTGTRLRAGDRQRGVAAVGMAHDPDAVSLDVGTELRVFQHGVDDARHLFRPSDPHAWTRYVLVLSSWVRRGRDNIATRGQRHREIPVVQGEPTGAM